MIFTIGVMFSEVGDTAVGLLVPALCVTPYYCCSASPTNELVALEAYAKDAIYTVLDTMVEAEFDIFSLADKGVLQYMQDSEFTDCEKWVKIDVDLSDYLSKPRNFSIDGILGNLS
jgi:hypothetical protein